MKIKTDTMVTNRPNRPMRLGRAIVIEPDERDAARYGLSDAISSIYERQAGQLRQNRPINTDLVRVEKYNVGTTGADGTYETSDVV